MDQPKAGSGKGAQPAPIQPVAWPPSSLAHAAELADRFVFMSGDVVNPELRDFAEAHGIGLLAKPFDLESVERTVRDLVDAEPEDDQPRG